MILTTRDNIMRKLVYIFFGLILLSAISVSAEARTLTIGPPDNYTQTQKNEYWYGGVAGILQACGYHSKAKKLRRIARMTPYGLEGLRRWYGIERYAGSCTEAEGWADDLLSASRAIEDEMQRKYSCAAGECTPRTNSTSTTVTTGASRVEPRPRSEFLSKDDEELCNFAISRPNKTWETSARWENAVSLAKQRGLTVDQCLRLMSGETRQAATRASSQTDGEDTARRLKKLQEYLDAGLITAEEAAKKRREILDEL